MSEKASPRFARHVWMADRVARRFRSRGTRITRQTLYQAALVGLWQADKRLGQDVDDKIFQLFAWKRLRGEVLDEIRRDSRLERWDGGCEIASSAPTAVEILMDKEAAAALWRSAAKLSTINRTVLERTLAGHSQTEIAAGVGVSKPRIGQILAGVVGQLGMATERRAAA